MKIFLLFFIFGVISSCTKELKYTKEDMLAKAKAADASATVILPDSLTAGVHCSDYTEGCLAAHIVQVRKLNFIAVEFFSNAQAIYAAKKFRGYYLQNWMFDDVTGEPTLEKFVSESLEAKKP